MLCLCNPFQIISCCERTVDLLHGAQCLKLFCKTLFGESALITYSKKKFLAEPWQNELILLEYDAGLAVLLSCVSHPWPPASVCRQKSVRVGRRMLPGRQRTQVPEMVFDGSSYPAEMCGACWPLFLDFWRGTGWSWACGWGHYNKQILTKYSETRIHQKVYFHQMHYYNNSKHVYIL